MADGVTFAAVRKLALALPGVEEGTSYGTPAFKLRGKLLARLREDGETLALRVGFDLRDLLMNADPETFYVTDHYRGYPFVLVRLPHVARARLRDVLEEAWKYSTPKALLAAHPSRRPG